MEIVIKNNTGSDVLVESTGTNVPASGQITVDRSEYHLWARADTISEMMTLTGASTLTVNNGSLDLIGNNQWEYLRGFTANNANEDFTILNNTTGTTKDAQIDTNASTGVSFNVGGVERFNVSDTPVQDEGTNNFFGRLKVGGTSVNYQRDVGILEISPTMSGINNSSGAARAVGMNISPIFEHSVQMNSPFTSTTVAVFNGEFRPQTGLGAGADTHILNGLNASIGYGDNGEGRSISNVRAVSAQTNLLLGGTIVDAQGIYGTVVAVGGGTIQTANSMRAEAPGLFLGGTIENAVSFISTSPTVGTVSNWNAQFRGTTASYHEGSISIGQTVAPTEDIDVANTARLRSLTGGIVKSDSTGVLSSSDGIDTELLRDDAQSDTTSTSFQNKMILATPVLENGATYVVEWSAEILAQTAMASVEIQVVTFPTKPHSLNRAYCTTSGTTDWHAVSGIDWLTGTGAAEFAVFQWRRSSGVGTASIRNARYKIYRVNEI